MIEKRIRGVIYYLVLRYAKGNNKYIKNCNKLHFSYCATFRSKDFSPSSGILLIQ